MAEALAELEEGPVAGVPAGPEGGPVAEALAELEEGLVAGVPAAGEVEQEAPVMGALAVATTPTVDSVPASPPEASRTTLGM